MNSTNNQVKTKKYPNPQSNEVELGEKSQGNKPQYDQIYQHHYNKNQGTQTQVQQHYLPQLHRIKQPQPPEHIDEAEAAESEQKNYTKRKQPQEILQEDEKRENEKDKEGTRVSYYPDPKTDSLSRSL